LTVDVLPVWHRPRGSAHMAGDAVVFNGIDATTASSPATAGDS
jgi:hypothetical protein